MTVWPEHLNIDRLFLRDRVDEGNGGRVALRLDDGDLTFAGVDALASSYAAALFDLEVSRSDRVLIVMPDGADYVGALFGILRVGAVAVMLNPGLTTESMAAIVAQSRASDSNVKTFAQRMLTDHGKANQELMSLAKSKGVALPPPRPTTSTANRKEPGAATATGTTGGATSGTSGTSGVAASGSDRLSGLKGAEFDRAYMSQMVEDHEADVEAFQEQADNAADAELKAFAAKTLPTLKKHLEQIKAIQAKLNK